MCRQELVISWSSTVTAEPTRGGNCSETAPLYYTSPSVIFLSYGVQCVLHVTDTLHSD